MPVSKKSFTPKNIKQMFLDVHDGLQTDPVDKPKETRENLYKIQDEIEKEFEKKNIKIKNLKQEIKILKYRLEEERSKTDLDMALGVGEARLVLYNKIPKELDDKLFDLELFLFKKKLIKMNNFIINYFKKLKNNKNYIKESEEYLNSNKITLRKINGLWRAYLATEETRYIHNSPIKLEFYINIPMNENYIFNHNYDILYCRSKKEMIRHALIGCEKLLKIKQMQHACS